MDPADLEREIHDRLNRGTTPRAPHTLRPRVMAGVQAWRARPWYLRPWFTWPSTIQVGSVVSACVVVAVGLVWAPMVFEQAGLLALVVRQYLASAVQVEWPASLRLSVELIVAARIVWQVLLGPVVFYVSIFAVVVGALVAMCAALLTRVTLGRATV